MSLSQDQIKEVERIAELQTRRYFDHYLQNVWPVQAKSLIDTHNADEKAHGGVRVKLSKLILIIAASGGVGGGLTKLLTLIG